MSQQENEELFFKNDLDWTKAGHLLAAEQILAHVETGEHL
jgi:hypothetical protein